MTCPSQLDLLPSGLYRRLRLFTGSADTSLRKIRSLFRGKRRDTRSLAGSPGRIRLTAGRELCWMQHSPCPEDHDCWYL